MVTALSLSGAGAGAGGSLLRRRPASRGLAASRADDSSPAPFEVTVKATLNLLGVAEGASFNKILHAKKAVAASCKDDPDAVAQMLNKENERVDYVFREECCR